jgi:hypothetical protein
MDRSPRKDVNPEKLSLLTEYNRGFPKVFHPLDPEL